MLTSLALIFIVGLSLSHIFRLLRLPPLLGLLITGLLLGPYALNLIDSSLLSIAPDLRQIALIIILTRAGLSLHIKELKAVGRPALLLCFVPACFEIAGTLLLAPPLLGVSLLEAAILGSVLAAVSPAVVVPRMLRLLKEGYGKDKNIPQMIMAGASVDDVFVIVLFTSFTGLANTGAISPFTFAKLPLSIAFGIGGGILVGTLLAKFFKTFSMRDTVKILLLLSTSFLLVAPEKLFPAIPFSGLLAVISAAATLLYFYPILSTRLAERFGKLWVGAEILLFVLVGASVDFRQTLTYGFAALLVLLGALVFRAIGVAASLSFTSLNRKERLFCIFAYLPKATVQAAIGGIPLSMGLACGPLVLSIAVLSIFISAPLGAVLIDATYKKLLCQEKPANTVK